MITTFVFRVRNVPAALYKAMGGFATNGVNMTKLESYQLGGSFFATQFYADVEGHPKDAAWRWPSRSWPSSRSHVRLLGTYPAHPFRAEIAEPAEEPRRCARRHPDASAAGRTGYGHAAWESVDAPSPQPDAPCRAHGGPRSGRC